MQYQVRRQRFYHLRLTLWSCNAKPRGAILVSNLPPRDAMVAIVASALFEQRGGKSRVTSLTNTISHFCWIYNNLKYSLQMIMSFKRVKQSVFTNLPRMFCGYPSHISHPLNFLLERGKNGPLKFKENPCEYSDKRLLNTNSVNQ